MSKYPLYDSLVNQQSNSKGINTAGPLSIMTEPVQLTRDDIIANLDRPGNWDLLKSSKFAGSAWGDMWGTNQFDNYEEWKSWFIEQHPENISLMNLTPKGGDVTVGTENMPLDTEVPIEMPTGMPVGTSTMPSTAVSASTPTEPNNYMGQSIGGLADYLQTSNMPFGTMKDMGGVSNVTPEAKAWRGKYSWE